MENEFDTIESQNDTEITENQDEQYVDETEESDEPTEDEKDKVIKTLEAQKEHWRKKALESSKSQDKSGNQEKSTVQSSNDLSQKDLFAMVKANVSTEDFDEVVEYAKFKKVSVTEALQSSTLKAILSEKNEQRKTALATNTGSSRRSGTKLSDEALLENAAKGNLPESDEDIRRLVQLRQR